MVTADSRNRRFFIDLEPIRDFGAVFSGRGFEEVPADWFLIRVDALDPLPAGQTGRDAELLTALGMAAMALANLEKGLDFAFVYGGDSLTACLPPDNLAKIRSVLADTRNVVRNLFQVELRLAVIPVEALTRGGHPVKAGKFRISTWYDQVCLIGPGLDHADKLIRGRDAAPQFLLPAEEPVTEHARFHGLSTRWRPVSLDDREMVSLVIRPQNDPGQELAALARIWEDLEKILGKDCLPLTPPALKLSFAKTDLKPEAQALTRERASLKTFARLWASRFEIFWTRLAGWLELPVRRGHRVLSQLKTMTCLSAGWRHIEGSLRLVVAVSPEIRAILEGRLQALHRENVLNFGLHAAPAVRLLSLVHPENRKEVHLVDGLGGGLAEAAKMFRQQATGE